MLQPQDFEVQGKQKMVCKLQKSLYGLKQALRQSYKKFDSFMYSNGFLRCQADHYCYVKRFDKFYIFLFLHIDDMLIDSVYNEEIGEQEVVKIVCNEGPKGNKTNPQDEDYQRQSEWDIEVIVRIVCKEVLIRFNMDGAKPVTNPLACHLKLSKEQSPSTEQEQEYIARCLMLLRLALSCIL